MLNQFAGIERIENLYIQLLYACNFRCKHCFHGEKLNSHTMFSLLDVQRLVELFVGDYHIKKVTLLGGEPFAYPFLDEVINLLYSKKLEIIICTNGYKISDQLNKNKEKIRHLRVSIDGLEKTHDWIRRKGSFDEAIAALVLANQLDIKSSVTTTLTSRNIDEIVPLIELLISKGVEEIKIHPLRVIGYAKKFEKALTNYDVQIHDAIVELETQIQNFPIRVVIDKGIDLDPQWKFDNIGGNKKIRELNRAEIQPNGEIYASCIAVGANSSRFFYNRETAEIELKADAAYTYKFVSPYVIDYQKKLRDDLS